MKIRFNKIKRNNDSNGRIFLYTDLKESLESRGVDNITAGQTSWLFVSFLIAIFFSIILSIIVFLFDIKILIPTTTSNVDDMLIYRFLIFLAVIHFCFVMIRLKYFLVNSLFSCVMYIIFIVFNLQNIYIVVLIGLFLFVLYLLIPFYSWRIKILDGILYFFYTIIIWFILHYY